MNCNISLQDIDRMAQHPQYQSMIFEWQYKVMGIEQSYSDFADRIESEIESIVLDIESNRPYYTESEEDQISSHIVSMLKQKCIDATHGSFYAGSTDILVKHGSCQWIGEAKWHRSDDNILEGMRQLSTRYSSGSDKCCRGGMIIYNNTSNVNEKITRLKKHWENNGGNEYVNMKVLTCLKSSSSFLTTHVHCSSGLSYLVRHRWISLHHDPQDKSAKAKKNREP